MTMGMALQMDLFKEALEKRGLPRDEVVSLTATIFMNPDKAEETWKPYKERLGNFRQFWDAVDHEYFLMTWTNGEERWQEWLRERERVKAVGGGDAR